MSRIGRLPIPVPSGVDVAIDGRTVNVSGPKGKLSHTVAAPITVERGEDGTLLVQRPDDERESRALHVQVVDDTVGRTLVSASTLDASLRGAEGDKSALARRVGTLVAERAKAAGITAVVFDRGGNRYAGRIAALADGAREAGLDF